MAPVKNLILKGTEVEQKIKRMAYEIYENNFDDQEAISQTAMVTILKDKITEETIVLFQ